jgi:hypothetical protein
MWLATKADAAAGLEAAFDFGPVTDDGLHCSCVLFYWAELAAVANARSMLDRSRMPRSVER